MIQPFAQVELGDLKIVWPRRVAIVGYGVKGVRRGGKAWLTLFSFFIFQICCATIGFFVSLGVLANCQVNIGERILKQSDLKDAWEHRLHLMLKNEFPGRIVD